MRAKLVKKELGYILFDEKGIPIGTTPNVLNNNTFSKLSLKNCQVIERGYDLDELWKETIFSESISINSDIGESFKAGFQKALEILGDQRFTDKDLDKAIEYGHESRMPFNEDWYKNLSNPSNKMNGRLRLRWKNTTLTKSGQKSEALMKHLS